MRSRILWFASALLALLSLVCQWRIGFNNDNAWLLYAAGRLLDGARLYVDVVEINPPLIVWLNVPVVWIARTMGLNALDVFRVALFTAALASAGACQRLSNRAFPALAGGAVFFAGVLVLLAMSVVGFGQREHLLLVLVLPYLFLSAVRLARVGEPRTAGEPLTIGALAGLGLALKPHFLLIWVLVVWLEARSRRQVLRWHENRALVALGLLYGLTVLIVTPEYVTLVRRLGGVYAAYRTQGLPTILLGRFEPLSALIGLGIYAVYRRAVGARPLADVLALATVGCLGGVLLQGKGFDYHYYPALALGALLMAVVSFTAAPQGQPLAKRGRLIAAALLLIVSAVYLEAGVRTGLGPEHSEMRTYRALELAVGPVKGRSLMVLAPRSGYAFGLVTYGGAHWIGRFPCLWVPPVVYRGAMEDARGPRFRAVDDMPPVERWFRAAVVSDALRARPELILVGVPTPGQGPDDYWFDFLKYFSEDATFARLMTDYERVGESVGYVIYERRERART